MDQESVPAVEEQSSLDELLRQSASLAVSPISVDELRLAQAQCRELVTSSCVAAGRESSSEELLTRCSNSESGHEAERVTALVQWTDLGLVEVPIELARSEIPVDLKRLESLPLAQLSDRAEVTSVD